MKDNTYLVSQNCPCPVCKGAINCTKSGLFYSCIDCHRVYRVLFDDNKYGGEHDLMLQCINEEKVKIEG